MDVTMVINRNDVDAMRSYIEKCVADPSLAARRPVLTGVWTGGDRCRVAIGGKTMGVNEPGTLGPMQLVLAALVSCEIDVIQRQCTLMGVEIEDLTVEARGEFDVRAYLGLAGAPPSGYERISYTARVRAPSLTEEQLERLREAVEHASPVGDTLGRGVRVETTVERLA